MDGYLIALLISYGILCLILPEIPRQIKFAMKEMFGFHANEDFIFNTATFYRIKGAIIALVGIIWLIDTIAKNR